MSSAAIAGWVLHSVPTDTRARRGCSNAVGPAVAPSPLAPASTIPMRNSNCALMPPSCPHVTCRSGYEAQISLFMAPLNYTLGDYTQWSEDDAVGSQQVAWVRIKTHNTIPNTWVWAYSSVNSSYSSTAATGGQLSQVPCAAWRWPCAWRGHMDDGSGRSSSMQVKQQLVPAGVSTKFSTSPDPPPAPCRAC